MDWTEKYHLTEWTIRLTSFMHVWHTVGLIVAHWQLIPGDNTFVTGKYSPTLLKALVRLIIQNGPPRLVPSIQ
jgi:hypothetical protein